MVIQFNDDRLQVKVTTKGCDLSPDERARLRGWLEPLAGSVHEFPGAQLRLNATHHPRSAVYHVECELKLPGRTPTWGRPCGAAPRN